MLLTSIPLKCSLASRCHHLVKTFWGGPHGWRDKQFPEGTVIWTSPGGQTHTTRPGSHALFPTLCRPTAPVPVPATATAQRPTCTLTMPRRQRTRAQDRAHRINAERRLNEIEGGRLNDDAAERSRPPPLV